MSTRADLHQMLDELGEEHFKRVAVALQRLIHHETGGSGAGGGRRGRAPFENFPPPLPLKTLEGRPASYHSLGEGQTRVEQWEVWYFDEADFVSVTQLLFHGHAFQREERWKLAAELGEIVVEERTTGPGHDSARRLVFAL